MKLGVTVAVIAAMALTACARDHRRAASSTSTTLGSTSTTTSGPEIRLPIGDGKVASGPRTGYVFACDTAGRGGGPPPGGATSTGRWIKGDGTWAPAEKPHVTGSVSWPQAAFSPSLQGERRVLTGNGLPLGITTGTFPVRASDPAYRYDHNPNAIRASRVDLALPAHPTAATTPTCLSGGPIGIMTDGVYLFDALDAQNRDAPAHEVLDSCGGHPQEQGMYHYHALPDCFASQVGGRPALVGYALDGFGIFVETKPNLAPYTDADLDQCHGRTGNVTWDGADVTMYHYVATAEFPYTVGCFRGTPASSSTSPGP